MVISKKPQKKSVWLHPDKAVQTGFFVF